VDDVEKTLMQSPSDLRLPSYVPAGNWAPNAAAQGTAVSCAGTSPVVRGDNATGVSDIPVHHFLLVQVASPVELVGGARSTDLPGLLPRAAPV
jgi:hypothetical protein